MSTPETVLFVPPRKPRRIVRAVAPSRPNGGDDAAAAASSPSIARVMTDETGDSSPGRDRHSPYAPVDAAVRRELAEDAATATRRARRGAADAARAVRRERRQWDRRDGQSVRYPSGGATAPPQANPFSRFLSAFSVLPRFPQRKRALRGSDAGERDGKRRRAAAERHGAMPVELDDGGGGSDGPATSGVPRNWATWPAMAATVAVAVVAALLTMRRYRRG